MTFTTHANIVLIDGSSSSNAEVIHEGGSVCLGRQLFNLSRRTLNAETDVDSANPPPIPLRTSSVMFCHGAPEHALFFAFFSLLLRAFLSFIFLMDFTLFQPFPGCAGGYAFLDSFVTWSHLTC
jgi:hypothetical protein